MADHPESPNIDDLTPEEASRIIHSHRKVRYGTLCLIILRSPPPPANPCPSPACPAPWCFVSVVLFPLIYSTPSPPCLPASRPPGVPVVIHLSEFECSPLPTRQAPHVGRVASARSSVTTSSRVRTASRGSILSCVPTSPTAQQSPEPRMGLRMPPRRGPSRPMTMTMPPAR